MAVSDIKGTLKGVISRIGKRELLILFLIFTLGLAIRGYNMDYELFFGFDSYFHARMGAYTIENFSIPDRDPLAYYQVGGGVMPSQGGFFWFFIAVIYKIFTLGAAYNKELWIGFVKLLPAVFGGLISAAMYLLGKEMYNRRAGVAMGVFAAVVPSFVYRTMSGFLEEDALGFLWLVLGFVFLTRAIKEMQFNRNAVINAVISAFFFGLMAWTWEMFLLIPLVLVGYLGIVIVVFWFRNIERARIFDFLKIFLIAFLLFSGVATLLTGTLWMQRSVAYVTQYLPVTADNIERAQTKGSDVLAQTVGEENTGAQFFGYKYNVLIILPLIAFLLIPFRLFRSKREHLAIIIFVWTAITFYMAWSKLKFTYTLGLPIAACGGFVFNEIFIFLKGRTNFEKNIVAAALAFMLLAGIGAGTYFVTQRPPNIETTPGWKETLYWLKDNTAEDAKIFNWWDQGHWITFVAERKASADNRNADGLANVDFSKFVLAEDEGTAFSIIESIYSADYVVLTSNSMTNQISLGMYARDSSDLSDPNTRKYFGVIFPCGRNVDGLSGKASYVCGANTFDEAKMMSIPTTWQPAPNTLISEQIPGFIYRNSDNSAVYIVNAPTNNTFMVKLWSNDPSIEHFEEVYFAGGNVKVFKVLR
ncbi:MAG: STT3 domain-containing protein [Candidatus Diapherotrites archaeon]|nr:hypothetical protein [Candidatus Micrarchaeota archaeon]MBU1940108.1 hypothetical protein [Candidatus Micrarchaeota archaeon]